MSEYRIKEEWKIGCKWYFPLVKAWIFPVWINIGSSIGYLQNYKAEDVCDRHARGLNVRRYVPNKETS